MADVLQSVKGELAQPALLNANGSHGHPKAVARQKKELVHAGRLLFGRRLKPVTQRTKVVVTYCFPERDRAGRSQANRARDAANWAPTSKCLIDGLTAAGIWPDDNDAWVEGPDNRIGEPHGRTGFVEIWITLEPVAVKPLPPSVTIVKHGTRGTRPMCAARVERDLEHNGELIGEVAYFCTLEPHDPKVKHRGMTETGELVW